MHILEQIRTERGMSQRELAGFLEVSPALISEIERGNRNITAMKARQWADKLKVARAKLRPDIFGPRAA